MKVKNLWCIVLNLFLLNAFFLSANDLNSGKNYAFHPPLDIPLTLNGNFGEIRPNHFHSGLDLRTNGKSGLNVYAIDEGYVSRIYVSSAGYGQAIYITHPNGLTSVYGHLLTFAPKIEEKALEQHYAKESFVMNAFFEPDEVPVKKGEIIALSGNAGSSGGPHLHFEIRDTQTEEAMDPMLFGFDIKDTKRPQITRIRVFLIENEGMVDDSNEGASFSTVFYGDQFHLSGKPHIKAWGKVGIGVEAIDYLDGTWSKCGIAKMQLSVDGKVIYRHNMDRFAFSESRYINTFIDYDLYKTYSRKYMRAYKAQPNNQLSVYEEMENDGIITFNDGSTKQLKLEIWDSHQNSSVCNFEISGSKQTIVPKDKVNAVAHFAWNQDNTYKGNGITIVAPAGALYDNLDLQLQQQKTGFFASPIYVVQNQNTALQHPISIKIEGENLSQNPDKYFISNVYDGRLSGGQETKREGNQYSISTKSFGDFALALDTVPPKITPIGVAEGRRIFGAQTMGFKMSDGESGIQSYRGEIDGKWALFKRYRPDSNPTYYFDATRLAKGTKHHLHVVVVDNVGNESHFDCEFYW